MRTGTWPIKVFAHVNKHQHSTFWLTTETLIRQQLLSINGCGTLTRRTLCWSGQWARTFTRHTAVLYPENKHIISIWVLRRALEYDMMISPVLYIIKHRRAAATPVGRGGRFLWLCFVLVAGGRRHPDVLVAGPGWGEEDLLGGLPAWGPAVLLWPAGELPGHELLL